MEHEQVALEERLAQVQQLAEPDVGLEQYPTPAPLAVRMLSAAHGRGDIAGKRVLDLGCGCGVLGLGAALLGSASTTGLDIDPRALAQAKANRAALAAALGCVAAHDRPQQPPRCLTQPLPILSPG
jgi:predicted RNA methylase